jgi:Holliday junction resolvasome RuvABC endonuclease subunit
MTKETILAIDPGNKESGYAFIEMPDFKLIQYGKIANKDLVYLLERYGKSIHDVADPDVFAIEKIASYGMAVGKDVFDTCIWIGQFVHALKGRDIAYVYRKDEKMYLCGTMKAKDSNIRQELINRYAKFDFKNGKGTKKQPDTFYGVSKDVWQAIAVGVTYYEMNKEREAQWVSNE